MSEMQVAERDLVNGAPNPKTRDELTSSAKNAVCFYARCCWAEHEFDHGLGWAIKILDRLESGKKLSGRAEHQLAEFGNSSGPLVFDREPGGQRSCRVSKAL